MSKRHDGSFFLNANAVHRPTDAHRSFSSTGAATRMGSESGRRDGYTPCAAIEAVEAVAGPTAPIECTSCASIATLGPALVGFLSI